MDGVHLVQNPMVEPIDTEKTPGQVAQNISIRLAFSEGFTEQEALEAFIDALPDIVTTDKGDIRLMFVVS